MEDVSEQRQLLELIKAGQKDPYEEVDTQQVRYAIYARKSTTSEDRQASSIEDQIRECMERVVTAPNMNLNVVKVYQESYSAKIADTREEFNKLIEDIQVGRIDGLIAWHPDRLSRNMKEAGTIIDLVDKGSLKDLKFATFTFENNPAGKMLLGITFVMAKQYSEHLSESVDRGNKHAVEAGEFIGKFKHGYIIDTQRHFQPDPDHFTNVKHMFTMSLEGSSQKDIREWINQQDYKVQKRPQTDPVKHVWSKDDVSELLRDPHYVGVHKWGKSLVVLEEFYEFESMLTVPEFLKINKIDSLNSSKILSLRRPKGGDPRANLLRGMVYCDSCNQPFTSMIIDKRDPQTKEIVSSRYYYKCETEDCSMSGKSLAAGVVIDFVKDLFERFLFITESNYEDYVKNAKLALKNKSRNLDTQIARLRAEITNKSASYDKVKKLIEDSPKLQAHYDLDKYLKEINGMKIEYERLLNRRQHLPDAIPTYEKYLKLFSSTSDVLSKIRDMKQMDALIRIFFSNFYISNDSGSFRKGSKVVSNLKEPWSGFLKDDNFVRGAGEETLTLDLFLGKEAL